MATYIELKADDVMPWGKYIGISLRAIYKLDADYFQYLCSRTKEYSISSKTQKIVIKDLLDQLAAAFLYPGKTLITSLSNLFIN